MIYSFFHHRTQRKVHDSYINPLGASQMPSALLYYGTLKSARTRGSTAARIRGAYPLPLVIHSLTLT